MKYIVSLAVLSLMTIGANAAQNARPAMSGKIIMAAPRYTASVNQLNGASTASVNQLGGNSNVAVHTDPVMPAQTVDRREAERNACINNNIGIGNTFVWASRYSDTSNYATMTEDTDNPQNNVCFMRVELKSDDAKISVADVPAKYFMWGESVECGSWADEKEMEKRILDAKKGARVGGIVASTVGGAGLGVGAMELFGNRLIGGKVMGQKDKNLSNEELLASQIKSLQNRGSSAEANDIVNALTVLKQNNVQYVDVDGGNINVELLMQKLK